MDDDFALDVCTDKENKTVWLVQKDMATLFDVSTDNIGFHIVKIFQKENLIIQQPKNSR